MDEADRQTLEEVKSALGAPTEKTRMAIEQARAYTQVVKELISGGLDKQTAGHMALRILAELDASMNKKNYCQECGYNNNRCSTCDKKHEGKEVNLEEYKGRTVDPTAEGPYYP